MFFVEQSNLPRFQLAESQDCLDDIQEENDMPHETNK